MSNRESADQQGEVHIAALCGSLSENSKTRAALAATLRGAAEIAADTSLIDLRDYQLPFFGQSTESQDVEHLREKLAGNHGFIVGTPEYHGSVSGVLKNALDLVGAEAFTGKIVGLLGVAGGAMGAVNSLNTMRTIGRNLQCWVIPAEVSIAHSHAVVAEDGSILDGDIEARLLDLGRQVARFATLQQRARQDEFLQLWEGLPRW